VVLGGLHSRDVNINDDDERKSFVLFILLSLQINSWQWKMTKEEEKLNLLKYKVNNIDRLQDLVVW